MSASPNSPRQPIASHVLQWAGVGIWLVGAALALAGVGAIVAGLAHVGAALKIPALASSFGPMLAHEVAGVESTLGPILAPWGVGALHVALVLFVFALAKGAFLWAEQLNDDGKARAQAAGCTKYDE
jgi:hypothetical protein